MFDYHSALRALIADVVATTPLFAHVRLDEVGIGVMYTKTANKGGVLAKCVPLRFEGGQREGVVRGRRCLLAPVVHQGHELKYLILFMLPRFQDYSRTEQIKTVFHELYHISPAFDGDIRRFPGPNPAHGPSREWFDRQFDAPLQTYLARLNPAAHPWLGQPFTELTQRLGGLRVMRFAMPRPIALDGLGSAREALIRFGPAKPTVRPRRAARR